MLRIHAQCALGFALLAFAVAGGCGAPQAGWGVHTLEWNHTTATEPGVPGVDAACVYFALYGDAPAAIVWTDGAGGGVSARHDASRGANVYEGKLSTPDGRSFSMEIVAEGDQSGTITIDGQRLSLADGALVLISTAGGRTTVKQLKRDVLSFPSDLEPLREWATLDDQIKSFFAAQSEPTPAPD